MKLYLIQHAKAKTKEEDLERQLTEEGLKNLNKVADFLFNNVKVDADIIFHSGKNRTRHTAEVLAEKLEIPMGSEEMEALTPNIDISVWIKRLQDMREGENIMLVSHTPYLNKLIAYLLSGNQDKDLIAVKHSGMICLERDENGKWKILWMFTPDVIK